MVSLIKRTIISLQKGFGRLFKFKYSKATLALFFVVLLAGGLIFFIQPVRADGIFDVSQGIATVLSKIALGLGEFCIKMSIFFLRFFIALAQYNGYIDSPVVKLGWLMVRDVVNMFFVVILLVIAIGTILGIEQYQWNKTLVKLILSAVFVNFSNLICQIFIDAAQVFTMTFISAVSATAGGNLIKMFQFEKIYQMVGGTADSKAAVGDISIQILIGSIVAFLFALFAMLIMGAYAIVMLLRMVALWVLIILSPLAFLFIALPQTQNRYGEWWKEFSNYVVVGPTIAFFMWLSFATAGTGTLGTDLGLQMEAGAGAGVGQVDALTQTVVSTWENMANFLVALFLLIVGLQEVQKLNVAGGSMAAKAKDFVGKVATIATGYAAGRWLVGKAGQGAGAVGKFAAMEAPIIGGRKWKLRAKNIGYDIGAWAQGGGKRTEDMGFFQKGVSWFAKRRAFEDKFSEAKKARYETAGEVNKESSSAHTVGDDLRQMRARLAGIKTYKSERDAESLATGAAEEIGKGREQHRYWANVNEKGEREEGTWSLHTFAKLLGLSSTVNRGEEKGKGTIAEEAAGKKLLKETGERTRDDKLKEARILLILKGDKELKEAGDQMATEDKRLFDPTEQPLVQVFEDKKKLLAEKQEGIITEYKEKEKDQLETPKQVSTELREQLAGYRSARQDLEDYQIAKKREKELVSTSANNDIIISGAKLKIDDLTRQIEGPAIDPKKKVNLARQVEKEKEILTTAEEKKKKDDGDLKGVREGLEGKEEAKLALKVEKEKFLAREKLDRDGVLVKKIGGVDPDLLKKDTGGRLDLEAMAKALTELISSRQKTFAGEREKKLGEVFEGSGLEEAEVALKNYRASDGYKKRKEDPKYKRLEAEVAKKKEEIINGEKTGKKIKGQDERKGGVKNPAAKWVLSKYGSEATGAHLTEAEQALQHTATETDFVKDLIAKTEFAKMGEEAAKKFIEEIRHAKIAEAMKKGGEIFKKAVEGAAKGVAFDLSKLEGDNAARLSYAKISANYASDRSSTASKTVEDTADTMYAAQRYGMDTPASAFKALIKKRMEESFSGVEREQGVVMALGSMQKLLNVTDSGGSLDSDQQAQMMGNIQFLTKNGWSDDLLAKVVRVINGRNSLTGQARIEAEMLKKIFVDRLKWGKDDGKSGKIIRVNNSSGERTNDLHRLIGYQGDADMLQSENAVLHMMRGADGKTEVRGYYEAAEKLAETIKTQLGGQDATTMNNTQWGEMAKKMGMTHQTAGEEVKAFAKKFVSGADSAVASLERFKSTISNFSDSNELLADYKNLALQTAHLDDGGHGYYDMDAKVARGQLADSARAFILSDWRKIDVRERVKRLKTHSNSKMDEDYSTGSFVDRESFQETYEGGITKPIIQSGDARNMQLIIKQAAGEKIRKSDEGRLMVGHEDSALVTGTYGDEYYGKDKSQRQLVAFKDIARDWAQYLDIHPEVLLSYLGQSSGVKFEDAIAGKLNLLMGDGAKIDDIGELIKWVKKYQGTMEDFEKDTEQYFEQSTAGFVDFSKRGNAVIKQVRDNAFKDAGRSRDNQQKENEDEHTHGGG